MSLYCKYVGISITSSIIRSSIISILFISTASSATKELDDLMASLSDFKVNAQRDSRTPTLSPPEEKPQNTPGSGGGMVSKSADYAKVDKNHQSFKGKQGLGY